MPVTVPTAKSGCCPSTLPLTASRTFNAIEPFATCTRSPLASTLVEDGEAAAVVVGATVVVELCTDGTADTGAVAGIGVTGAGAGTGAGLGTGVAVTGGSAVTFKVNVMLCERLPDEAFTVMG